jgi:hypothetical protein
MMPCLCKNLSGMLTCWMSFLRADLLLMAQNSTHCSRKLLAALRLKTLLFVGWSGISRHSSTALMVMK